jgi:hypothetical protein
MPNTERIRQLNDELRTTFQGGKIVATQGVIAIGDMPTILKQLREFSAFDQDNDPHHEHDFGAFKYKHAQHERGDGPLIYFKLDYYDRALQFGSPDPAVPELTTRVLTIMLAEEY